MSHDPITGESNVRMRRRRVRKLTRLIAYHQECERRKMSELEPAAELRWKLMNSFGYGPYYDGLVSRKIAELDARIEELRAKQS